MKVRVLAAFNSYNIGQIVEVGDAVYDRLSKNKWVEPILEAQHDNSEDVVECCKDVEECCGNPSDCCYDSIVEEE